MTESSVSIPSRKSDQSSVQPRRYPTNTRHRADREDKDSGYMGSEASKKLTNQATAKDRWVELYIQGLNASDQDKPIRLVGWRIDVRTDPFDLWGGGLM